MLSVYTDSVNEDVLGALDATEPPPSGPGAGSASATEAHAAPVAVAEVSAVNVVSFAPTPGDGHPDVRAG
jgi:hypothetical protein